jgi:excisionase family DNA binding protein
MRGELNKVRKFAEKLNIAEKTAWGWIAQGRVGVVRLGRSVRVPQEEIDRLIEEGFTPARQA